MIARHRLITLILIGGVGIGAVGSASAQTPVPTARAQGLLDSLSPEERVGQLFLVGFVGTDTLTESQIHDLVTAYHVGGIVLTSGSDNFVPAPETATAAYDLISRLQRLEWDAARTTSSAVAGVQQTPGAYIPLLIGISQEGGGYPNDQILNGLTPLPSAMAIGATWNPELSGRVGEVQGRELSALGFNLYLGPSLDVLESPNPGASGDMGSGVFGGDPYWVAEMGRAYVSGLHSGSDGRLLVVAKHFPGRGGSDRRSEDEVSTVRKSLEQLKQIELAPFFGVAPAAPGAAAVVDGLLVSHIRYQGFQGNIRATTRPVSFDPQALAAILALPEFQAWRQGGGVLISDDLGTRAVREFYAPGDAVFSARAAARDAFLAGNDVLYLGGIVSPEGGGDSFATTVAILDFFAQKYREDAAFAQRVDGSVLRILEAKHRLYPNWSVSRVVPRAVSLESLGRSADTVFDVARESATLISPEPSEFASLLPAPPQARDRLVFISDTPPAPQCSTCPPQSTPHVDSLQDAVLGLYGPEGGNQTSSFLLSSYSLDTLRAMLDGEQPPYLEADIGRADWLIVTISGSASGEPRLVSRLLSERPELLQRKNIILFSLGAPYYFDATDISRLTAYYALYSKQPQFLDVAARLLFQEVSPSGSSPVSVPGIGYDLISVMRPDPSQVITLSLEPKSGPAADGDPATPVETPVPLFRIGDSIVVRTGILDDLNGHPVPDGTVVRFEMTLGGQGSGIVRQLDAETANGVARAAFGLEEPGLLEISASSEQATLSEVLQLDVSQTGAVAVTVVAPALTPPPGAEPPVADGSPEETGLVSGAGYPGFDAWLLSMMFVAASAWLAYSAGHRGAPRRAGIVAALGTAVGGLLAFDYAVLGLPGAMIWASTNGLLGLLGLILSGEVLGFVLSWLWLRRVRST